MGVLTVVLEKVTDIVDHDRVGKTDPYIKFELEQDRTMRFDKSYGHKKSTKKRNNLNPVYNEVFVFEDVPSLAKMKLKVDIMDSDVGLDDNIGNVEIDLEREGLGEAPKAIQQKILCRNGQPTVFLKIAFIDAK